MPAVGVLDSVHPTDIVKEALERPTVFKDEGPLSLEYVPERLPHRDEQIRELTNLFRFVLEKPGGMSQRICITGDIGTGKTVLAQRFGTDLTRVAKNRKVNLHYVHVNCRECKGSFFMIMKRLLTKLTPDFPKRGFSGEELLQTVMDILDHKDAHLIIALDELESLIRTEPSGIYSLTRVQEQRLGSATRISLICILRDPTVLDSLDPSTIDTLQRNFVRLEKYNADQLEAILDDRIRLAFKENTIPDDNVNLIADLASNQGNARYAIEILWRAGKYADAENSKRVTAEHVRKAVSSVYPSLRGDYIAAVSTHEKFLLLALARVLQETDEPYAMMGEVERQYHIICEEYHETPRAHTQVWKYAQGLAAIGIITTQKSAGGLRGKTTFLGLASIPASAMRERLETSLTPLRKEARRFQQFPR
jgi:cell division control protein 6